MSEIVASTYEIIREIGSGGGGVVYLANHMRLEKKVILKADKRKITTRPDLLRREVDILKELRHTYIPQVYDYFIEDDTVYTVMDYIEGESLDKPLARGEKFSQAQVIAWAKEILEALEYLHSPIHGSPPRGYVHSDIKPANIMKRSNNDICLIDFNIALALGEENAIGRSQGYASPEHYGLDFSSGGFATGTGSGTGTEMLMRSRLRRGSGRDKSSSTGTMSSSSAAKRTVIPDVRSDIYSLGATLYHLLSGMRPEKEAKNVVPLSKREFSPQMVNIISKAMNPNPDLRFQSAREMLQALRNLHRNDVRAVRWRWRNRFAYTGLSLLLIAGITCSFLGLRRMQTSERWLRLTEDAQNVLQDGDRAQALQYVMQVYDEQQTGLLLPRTSPRTQEVLTEALGVYDVADEFRVYGTLQLPSSPLDVKIAPDASTAACICFGKLLIVDLTTAEPLVTLEMENSALAEAAYIDADTVVYAGADGITAYDISKGQELWKSGRATNIAVSGDGSTVAAVYKDNTYAEVYNAETGEQKAKVDFGQKRQSLTLNDNFVNRFDNLFCLNQTGNLLAVSFSDGSLAIKNLEEADKDIDILDDTVVPNAHYEGGFYQQYFAFSATTEERDESVFAVIDTETVTLTKELSDQGYYFTAADKNGIVLGLFNILQRIDPVANEGSFLIPRKERIMHYSYDDTYAMASYGDHVSFFDQNVKEVGTFSNSVSCDFLALKKDTAVVGSHNSPVLWILKHENHPEAQVLAYDPDYVHDEARLSADGRTVMLFRYDYFRIYDTDGAGIKDVNIPNAAEVYDQQYIRDADASYLEVIYNDGKLDKYDAGNGELLETQELGPPDRTLYEEFETDRLRVESPLHGARKVYRKDNGKMIGELDDKAMLTYFTEAGDYLIAQYMTTDDHFYGYLMDQDCQVLAYLPNLCDVLPGELLFDYSSGDIRKVKIYDLAELLDTARGEMKAAE